MEEIETGLSYDDVLLQPQASDVSSRSNVDTTVKLFDDISLSTPIISANMDTVTEAEMAQSMADIGGCGIVHRFASLEEQQSQIESVDGIVGGCVGVGDTVIETASALVSAGADFICVDVAHGHMSQCVETVEALSVALSVPIMAGNVATADGAIELIEAGAESIKVGVGPGSVCKTREVAGVGVPQFTAVNRVAKAVNAYQNKQKRMNRMTENPPDVSLSVVADGGITKSGDTVKALMAGADAVMCGGIVAGTEEAPGEVHTDTDGTKYKVIRGMASQEAREDNPLAGKTVKAQQAIEGVETVQKYTGTVESVIEEHMKGVRSGLSYCGGHTIDEARSNAEFIRVTNSTIARNGEHNTDSEIIQE